MALSKEEKAQLDALNKKANEPDSPSHPINISLDLSDDKAYDRAVKHGFINPLSSNGDDDGDDDADDDDRPRRRGYFGDSK